MKRAVGWMFAAALIALEPITHAKGPGGVAPLVPMTGTCTTEFKITEFLIDGFKVSLTGTCNLSHLGLTHVSATQRITYTQDPAVVSILHHSTYVAANGDVLVSEVTATGTFLDATHVALLGDEIYEGAAEGSNGRFANISPGSGSHIVGAALFTDVAAGKGVGAFTVSGQIGYQK